MLYLDHNATTFIHPKVKELLISKLDGSYNPSSIHSEGRKAKKIVEDAREQVASLVGINLNNRKYDVIFTSSGTESNNLIMKNYYDGDIFISAIEHLSIYNHIKYNSNIKIIRVDSNGKLDLNHLEELVKTSKAAKKIVSVMFANNESGVLQDISAISKITKSYGAKFHSDCVQAVGKIPVNIEKLGLDFCTISAHKMGGMQGASALIVKSTNNLSSLIVGGGQEKNMRSGTENVVAIAAFGLISAIIADEINARYSVMKNLQELLEKNLQRYKNVQIIAKDVPRLPNTTLFLVPKTIAQTKLIAFDLQGICVSSGSACSSGKITKSHVLSNMGIEIESANSSIRVSLSSENSSGNIEVFIKAFEKIYEQEIK